MAQLQRSMQAQETGADSNPDNSQADIPAPIARGGFAVDSESPFADGYSIEGETAALEPSMVDGVVPEGDPLRARYLQLLERKRELAETQAPVSTDPDGGNRDDTSAGPDSTGEDVREEPHQPSRFEDRADASNVGRLIDGQVDRMTLHTRQAYRLFMGRLAEPDKHLHFIPGGRHVARALRLLWLLTRNDNPYADWALLRHEQRIGQIHGRLEHDRQAALELMDQAEQRGLTFSILESAAPATLELGFGSPYGYAVAQLIIAFDRYVRVEKTLARKNLQSGQQVRSAIADVTRQTRGIFNETNRFSRWLTHKEVRILSRADFAPEAPADARNRVRFVSGVFGMVPSEIFTGELQPRHSMRWQRLSQHEQELLEQIAELNEQEPEAVLI